MQIQFLKRSSCYGLLWFGCSRPLEIIARLTFETLLVILLVCATRDLLTTSEKHAAHENRLSSCRTKTSE
eukprot:4758929-Amphidinium_carterae.1